MNNNMKIANAIVGVLLVVCLVVLYSLSSERKRLLEELQGLRDTHGESSVASVTVAENDLQAASSRSSGKGEKLQKDIDNLEAEKESLELAKLERETLDAIKAAGLANGFMTYSDNEEDPRGARQEGLDTSFRQFSDFVKNSDLTALPAQERKTLTGYMALRKKWNEIIYDPLVAVEEKIDVNKACAALDDHVQPILDKLFNSQYSDDYAAFKQMNDKLQQLLQNDTRTKSISTITITNENGEKEQVLLED
ncbi:MAG: hypothetical protein IKS67_11355 [Victivallales bacterium]|nr:hypothetical protein [Victivallales bacterium]